MRSVSSFVTVSESMTSLQSSHAAAQYTPSSLLAGNANVNAASIPIPVRLQSFPPPPDYDSDTEKDGKSNAERKHDDFDDGGADAACGDVKGPQFATTHSLPLVVSHVSARSTSVPPPSRRRTTDHGVAAHGTSHRGFASPFTFECSSSGLAERGEGVVNSELASLLPARDPIAVDGAKPPPSPAVAAVAAAVTSPNSPVSIASSQARSVAQSLSSHHAEAVSSVNSQHSVYSSHSQRASLIPLVSPDSQLSHRIESPPPSGAPAFERSSSLQSHQSQDSSRSHLSHANTLHSASTLQSLRSSHRSHAHQRAPASPVNVGNIGGESSFSKVPQHPSGFNLSSLSPHDRAHFFPTAASTTSGSAFENELSKTSAGQTSSKSDPLPHGRTALPESDRVLHEACSNDDMYSVSQRSASPRHGGTAEDVPQPLINRLDSNSSQHSILSVSHPAIPLLQARSQTSITFSEYSDHNGSEQSALPPTRRMVSLQPLPSSRSVLSLASVAPLHLRPTMFLAGIPVGPGGVPPSSPLVQGMYSPSSDTSQCRPRGVSNVSSEPSIRSNSETPLAPPSSSGKSQPGSDANDWSHELSSLAVNQVPKGVLRLSTMRQMSSVSQVAFKRQVSMDSVQPPPPPGHQDTPTPMTDPDATGEQTPVVPQTLPPLQDTSILGATPTTPPETSENTEPGEDAESQSPPEGSKPSPPDRLSVEQPMKQHVRSLSDIAAEIENEAEEDQRAGSDSEISRVRKIPPFLRKRSSRRHRYSESFMSGCNDDEDDNFSVYIGDDASDYSFLPSSTSISRFSESVLSRDPVWRRDSLASSVHGHSMSRSPNFGQSVLNARSYQQRNRSVPPPLKRGWSRKVRICD